MSIFNQRSPLRTHGKGCPFVVGCIGAAALAVSLAACGSTISNTTSSAAQPALPAKTTQQAAATTTQAPTFTQTTTTSAAAPTGAIGTSFEDTDDSGNVMDVKLTHVIDPAQGSDEFTTPNNGFRFVGTKFQITGKSGTFSDDANSDAALVGSNGQSYSPDFSDIAGCTNFNGGDYNVTPGVSTTGCVVFQVPTRVKVASVQWGGEFGGAPATWTP